MEVKKLPTLPTLPKKKQVAAYARVSSGKDAMLHSLSAQVSYYSAYIQKHPEWLYCGVYVDEAVTGTKSERPEFQRLLSDCRAGKIDMVITKSISRFARNTVTLLETVRELKALGIDVFFEEPNIHTLSAAGEMMLTVLASVAQEESRMTSERIEVTAALVAAAVKENATLPQSQEEYNEKYAAFEERFLEQKNRRAALEAKIEERKARAHELDLFMDTLAKRDLLLETWDDQLWLTLVEKGTVLPDGSINFLFKDGTEILAAE